MDKEMGEILELLVELKERVAEYRRDATLTLGRIENDVEVVERSTAMFEEKMDELEDDEG